MSWVSRQRQVVGGAGRDILVLPSLPPPPPPTPCLLTSDDERTE